MKQHSTSLILMYTIHWPKLILLLGPGGHCFSMSRIWSPTDVLSPMTMMWFGLRTVMEMGVFPTTKFQPGKSERRRNPLTVVEPQIVGDSIVLWEEDKLYVSFWTIAPPFNGTIFECDVATTCTEFAAETTAGDLQLDTKTPDQPQLILPNLVLRRVTTIMEIMSMSPPPVKEESSPPSVAPAPEGTDPPSTSPSLEVHPEGTEAPSDDPSSAMQVHYRISFGMVMIVVAFLARL